MPKTIRTGWGDQRASGDILVASSTWYGPADYECDGVDDDAEIQAAINSLSGGGQVLLTTGTFTTTAPITLPTNVKLEGAGRLATTIAPATNTFDAIRIGSQVDGDVGKTAGTTVADLGVTIPNGAASGVNGIYIYGASDVVLRDLSLQRGYTGLKIRNCDRSEFYDLKMANFELIGLHLVEGDGSAQADDTTILQFVDIDLDTGGGTNREGIRFDQVSTGANEHNRMLFLGGRIAGANGTGTKGIRVLTGMRNVSFKGIQFRYLLTDFSAEQASGDKMFCSFESCDFLGQSAQASATGTAFALGKSNEYITFFGQNKFDYKNYLFDCAANNPHIDIFGKFEGYHVAANTLRIQAGTPVIRNYSRIAIAGTAALDKVISHQKGAAATIGDGGTIAHGLYAAPTNATVTGSVAAEIITITTLDATNITVAIKKRADGSAGTSQTVYWEAEV